MRLSSDLCGNVDRMEHFLLAGKGGNGSGKFKNSKSIWLISREQALLKCYLSQQRALSGN